jgi:hypothetical protein
MGEEIMVRNPVQLTHHPDTHSWKQSRRVYADCPVTSKQAVITAQKAIFFNEQVKWWHCSVGDGWHIAKKRRRQILEINH